MKKNMNRLPRFAAFAIGLGLLAANLNAQQQGTFNLPVQAHFGAVVLQPGEHKIAVPRPSGPAVVFLTSNRRTQMTLPMATEGVPETGRNFLHLVKSGGEYYVTSYESGLSGKKFLFSRPKSSHTAGVGAEAEEATLISVDAQ